MLIKKNMVHAGTHTLHNNVNIDMALSQKWNKVAKNNYILQCNKTNIGKQDQLRRTSGSIDYHDQYTCCAKDGKQCFVLLFKYFAIIKYIIFIILFAYCNMSDQTGLEKW